MGNSRKAYYDNVPKTNTLHEFNYKEGNTLEDNRIDLEKAETYLPLFLEDADTSRGIRQSSKKSGKLPLIKLTNLTKPNKNIDSLRDDFESITNEDSSEIKKLKALNCLKEVAGQKYQVGELYVTGEEVGFISYVEINGEIIWGKWNGENSEYCDNKSRTKTSVRKPSKKAKNLLSYLNSKFENKNAIELEKKLVLEERKTISDKSLKDLPLLSDEAAVSSASEKVALSNNQVCEANKSSRNDSQNVESNIKIVTEKNISKYLKETEIAVTISINSFQNIWKQ